MRCALQMGLCQHKLEERFLYRDAFPDYEVGALSAPNVGPSGGDDGMEAEAPNVGTGNRL